MHYNRSGAAALVEFLETLGSDKCGEFVTGTRTPLSSS